ncbi:uncharacterized protein LOC142356757 [Convolutriloba macropyga]|uniref:uncharacterized protein LOC142356757 n=1 Tax=Convolutriloba macropyga TaxID=536237 RepID=UPI003F5217AF
MSSLIALDIANGSPFNASYEIEFDSEEMRLLVQTLCKNDTACMLDIALTNDTTFADVVEVLGGVIDIADIVNAIYRLNEPAWALPADEAPILDNLVEEDDGNVRDWIIILTGILFAGGALAVFAAIIFVMKYCQ